MYVSKVSIRGVKMGQWSFGVAANFASLAFMTSPDHVLHILFESRPDVAC